MMNKEKEIVKTSIIDVRYHDVWYGYAYYAYQYPIQFEKIECYCDENEYDIVNDVSYDSEYNKKEVKKLITRFVNLNNEKEYDYSSIVYKRDGNIVLLSYAMDD